MRKVVKSWSFTRLSTSVSRIIHMLKITTAEREHSAPGSGVAGTLLHFINILKRVTNFCNVSLPIFTHIFFTPSFFRSSPTFFFLSVPFFLSSLHTQSPMNIKRAFTSTSWGGNPSLLRNKSIWCCLHLSLFFFF